MRTRTAAAEPYGVQMKVEMKMNLKINKYIIILFVCMLSLGSCTSKNYTAMNKKKKVEMPPIFDSVSEYEAGEFILSKDSLLSQIADVLNAVIPSSREYNLQFDKANNKIVIDFGRAKYDTELSKIKRDIIDSLEKKDIKLSVVFSTMSH